MATKIGFKS